MKTNRRVGIMGGTFNPIHNGHLLLAKTAKDFLDLEKVIFIPTGDSYMKENVLSAEKRYHMTELAVSDQPDFEISDIELKRKGHSYTYETLEILKKENPDTDYFFLMGADSLFAIESWYQTDIICKLCTLVCVVRDDTSSMELSHQKAKMENKYHANVILLPFEKIDISSSQIRTDCRNQKDIRKEVPEKVLTFIKEEHLYQ